MGKWVTVTTRLTPEEVEVLDALAELMDMSRSKVMREILADLGPALMESATIYHAIRHGGPEDAAAGASKLLDALQNTVDQQIVELRREVLFGEDRSR